MKMNKTVLAVAIAGIAAAPSMASATTVVSGAVQMQLVGSDAETCNTSNPEMIPSDDRFPMGAMEIDSSLCQVNGSGEAFEPGDPRFSAGDVIWGVTASQALNIGLTGYGSLRVDIDNFSGGDIGSADNVFTGIRGGFGDLRFGEVANPGEYGQIADIVNDMGATINQGVGYVGSFGGFTVGVSHSPAPNQDVSAAGVKFGIAGLTLGAGFQDFDETTNFSVSAGFSLAGASVNLGFNSVEDGFTDANGDLDDETAIAAIVGYSIAGVSLALTYQAEQESEDEVVRFDASYNLGGGMDISTRINSFGGATSDDDSTDWRIQLSKSF